MSEYKAIKGKAGIRYMYGGRIVSKDSVPLELIDELNDSLKEPEAVPQGTKLCLFCGVYTNWKRFVNGQNVSICEEHYYEKTLGKIVEKLNEQQ